MQPWTEEVPKGLFSGSVHTWPKKIKKKIEMNISMWFYVGYISLGGLPLITYASRGVGGSTLMHTNAYKGGGGV